MWVNRPLGKTPPAAEPAGRNLAIVVGQALHRQAFSLSCFVLIKVKIKRLLWPGGRPCAVPPQKPRGSDRPCAILTRSHQIHHPVSSQPSTSSSLPLGNTSLKNYFCVHSSNECQQLSAYPCSRFPPPSRISYRFTVISLLHDWSPDLNPPSEIV